MLNISPMRTSQWASLIAWAIPLIVELIFFYSFQCPLWRKIACMPRTAVLIFLIPKPIFPWYKIWSFETTTPAFRPIFVWGVFKTLGLQISLKLWSNCWELIMLFYLLEKYTMGDCKKKNSGPISEFWSYVVYLEPL